MILDKEDHPGSTSRESLTSPLNLSLLGSRRLRGPGFAFTAPRCFCRGTSSSAGVHEQSSLLPLPEAWSGLGHSAVKPLGPWCQQISGEEQTRFPKLQPSTFPCPTYSPCLTCILCFSQSKPCYNPLKRALGVASWCFICPAARLPSGVGKNHGGFTRAASELNHSSGGTRVGRGGSRGGGLPSAGTNSLKRRGKKGQAGPASHRVAADETGKLVWG